MSDIWFVCKQTDKVVELSDCLECKEPKNCLSLASYQQGRADIISQLRELEKENYCPCQQGNCMYEVSEFSCVTCYLNKIEHSLP